VTTSELIQFAVERGEAYESQGAGKASKRDLTYYVLEAVQEAIHAKFMDNDEELIKDGVVAGALFAIWTEGVPNG